MEQMDLRDAIFDTIYNYAKKDKTVVFLTGDMGAFSLTRFQNEMPDQFFNLGIAEQNMINVACGMALMGKKVFVYSIIPFITMRCFEQIKVNVSDMNLDVNIIGGGTGFTYENDGPSHHGLEDIAIMRSLRNIDIYNPCDAMSAMESVKLSYNNKKPTYIRMDKGVWPNLYNDSDLKKGYFIKCSKKENLIITTGTIVYDCLKKHLDSDVLNIFKISNIKSLDGLYRIIESYGTITIVEENVGIGGVGEQLREMVFDNKFSGLFKFKMVKNKEMCQYGSRNYLRKINHLFIP